MSGARIALGRWLPLRPARGRRRARSRQASHLLRRIALIAALVLGGLVGGFLMLRDSSLVAATDVRISGLTGPDAPRIRTVLTDAASDMTTLHIRADQLRDAVAPYPVVKDIEVSGSFPHTLRIEVIEHDPVAAIVIEGRRVAVASDGTLIGGGGQVTTKLVALDAGTASAGGRLTDREALAEVALLGAAPQSMRPLIQSIGYDASGLRVQLAEGPVLVFGTRTRLAAKWASATRVLAAPDAAGGSYIDVRVPENAVAGRFAPEPEADPIAQTGMSAAEADAQAQADQSQGQVESSGSLESQ